MVKDNKRVFPKGKRVNQTFNYSNERVIAKLDLSAGTIVASKQQDQYKKRSVNFLGNNSPYQKSESDVLKQHVMREYCSRHNITDEKAKEAISKRFDKNIDVGFFEALQRYDMKYNNSKDTSKNKSMLYADAMLREVYRNAAESDADYREKEVEKRNSWLKKAGIELQYELGSKGIFGCKNPIYALKILSKIKQTQGLVTVMKDGKVVESNKPEISGIKHYDLPRCLTRKKDEIQKIPLKLKEQKDNIVLKAKGLSDSLRAKVKSDNFRKIRNRGLVTAGVIVLVGLSAIGISKMASNNAKTNDLDNASLQIAMTEEVKENDIQAISNYDIASNIVSVPEVTPEIAPEVAKEEAAPEISNVEKEAEPEVTMSATESIYGGFDFNTVFTAEEGSFYASPDGTGNHGNYRSGTAYKFNKIKAYNEDGTIKLYNVEDGNIDLLQVLAENPNARIAGHVLTSDGQIRGWEEDVQDLLISEITKNMSEEAKAEIASKGIDGDLSKETIEELKAASENYRVNAAQRDVQERDER